MEKKSQSSSALSNPLYQIWRLQISCKLFLLYFFLIFFSHIPAAPKEADVAGMKTDILNIPGVVGIHSYRVWSLTLDKMAVSAHISIGE